ncbi:hypothetical protein BDY19DRAFT_108365 [Irpex rosettiformis]|uniref:Uncharacterized protein n=1 Tax=Irpex rosettiformis TaxID=378272 RepID=A0ACB8U588_9APHY|nr:hypothetical protein BDY19DRAFT_108365 [Irpex rosettiformis]
MAATVIQGAAADFPLDQLYVHSFLHIVGITILFYDHILTFGEEISRIWASPGSGASLYFLLTRYFSFFVTITITFGNFSNSFSTVQPPSCLDYVFYRQVVLMATQILVGIMQFLRTYALYCKSKRIAALIFGVGAVLVSLSVWAVTGQQGEVSLQQGCHMASSKTSSIHIAVAWEALFTFDAMIFVLTLLKTYKERASHRLVRPSDLVSLVFRDGAIYFGVMMLAQGANVITFYVAPPALRGTLSTAASTISVTMISRLTLNLHSTAAHSEHINATTLPFSSHIISTLQFTMPYRPDEIADEEFEDKEESCSPDEDGRGCA